MLPKVSVCMITYAHKEFVVQAIESVLAQQTSFDYELVIGEDCSQDGTREIVVEYQKKYPETIRLLLPRSNLGMIPNLIQTCNACTGQYVALCEGDDYWTSPQKLQKQVDFLDTNSDFAICFHNGVSVWENNGGSSELLCPSNQKKVSNLEDIICTNFIPTPTVMFRNRLFGEFPDWFHGLKFGDWPLHILNAQYGKIGYIDEQMAVYRVHERGAASAAHGDVIKSITNAEGVIEIYKTINHVFNYRYDRLIRHEISNYYFALACEYRGLGNKRKSMGLCVKSLVIRPDLTTALRTANFVLLLLFPDSRKKQ